jgi:hypothetical protein
MAARRSGSSGCWHLFLHQWLPDLLHGNETRVRGDQAYRGQRAVIRESWPPRRAGGGEVRVGREAHTAPTRAQPAPAYTRKPIPWCDAFSRRPRAS